MEVQAFSSLSFLEGCCAVSLTRSIQSYYKIYCLCSPSLSIFPSTCELQNEYIRGLKHVTPLCSTNPPLQFWSRQLLGNRVFEWSLLSPSLSIGRMIPFTNLSLCNTYTNLLCEFDTVEKDHETLSLILYILLFKGSYNSFYNIALNMSFITKDCMHITYPKLISLFNGISYVHY